jgi:hypothetical protein
MLKLKRLQKATNDTDRGSAREFGDIELHEKLAPNEAGNPKRKLSGVLIMLDNLNAWSSKVEVT